MKVFIDTNIILEYLMQREYANAVEIVLDIFRKRAIQVFMSAGGFYSLLYIIDNYLKKELGIGQPERLSALRNIATQVLEDFCVAGQDNQILLQGISDTMFTDLEDSCQYQAALEAGCSLLLTFNITDYPLDSNGPIKVLTPQQYLDNS